MDKLDDLFSFLESEQKQLLRMDEIVTFRNMLMEARTHQEIEHITAMFSDLVMEIPKLQKHIKSAKRRLDVKGRVMLETYFSN